MAKFEKKVNTRLNHKTWLELKTYSDKSEISMSELIRRAIVRFVKEIAVEEAQTL